jgi:hypothetical protein
MGAFLNNAPKHAVSSTLGKLAWGPATLARGDLSEEVDKLSKQDCDRPERPENRLWGQDGQQIIRKIG